MIIKNLKNSTFEELFQCFQSAFENYFVKMPNDPNYFRERWEAAKVDYQLSYGMFDQGKLIGFIIHAIDQRNGVLTAFNTGTGVLPEYRGQRIVKSIYDYALKDLNQNGIQRSTLEVITQNELAIKAYESVGFQIYKHFKCYNGAIQLENIQEFDVNELKVQNIPWKKLPNQQFYSWDNQKETISNGNFRYFEVLYKQESESFFIIKPELNYLAQFDLLNQKPDAWQRLFSAIKQISDQVKINNVDDRLNDKITIIQSIGLKNTIDQYEMELNIPKL